MSDIGEEIQKRLEQAIPDAFTNEGGFTTKWLLITETVGPDGKRGLWTHTSSDLKPWDSLGMLHYAISLERDGADWDYEEEADE